MKTQINRPQWVGQFNIGFASQMLQRLRYFHRYLNSGSVHARTFKKSSLCCLQILGSVALLLVFFSTFSAKAQESVTISERRFAVNTDDDSEYPHVLLSFSLLGVDPSFTALDYGYSISGTNISITKGNHPKSPDFNLVTSNDTQSINLVLALDCSVQNVDDWWTVRQTALAVLSHLRPQDQVAIIAYGTQAEVIQKWVAGNSAEAQSKVQAIIPGYTRTAFNEALSKASELASTMTDGPSAVLLIGDRADNTINPTVTNDALKNLLAKERPPLYIYAYGPYAKNSEATFQQFINDSGSFLKIVDHSDQLVNEMQPLVEAMHRRFTIKPRFDVQVDNGDHQYQLQINLDQETITSTGEFRARKREVEIHLSGIDTTTPLFGMQNIATAITFSATTPISMTLYVNDQEKGFFPYTDGQSLQIDLNAEHYTSAVLSSSNVVTVVVQDEIGNLGKDSISFRIAQPFLASINTTAEEPIKIGDRLYTQIHASSEFTIERIELATSKLWTDASQLQQTTIVSRERILTNTYSSNSKAISIPHTLSLAGLGIGSYLLEMSAFDSMGRQKLNLPLSFQIRDLTWWEWLLAQWAKITWQMIWLFIGTILSILFILWLLLKLFAWLRFRYRNAQVANYLLNITNDGNIQGTYQFRAVDLQNNQLQFAFDWQTKEPPKRSQVTRRVTVLAPIDSTPIDSNLNGTKKPSPIEQEQQTTAGQSLNDPSKNFLRKRQQATRILGLSRPVADFFNLVSQILGPFGEPARRAATQLRSGVNIIEQAERTAERNISNMSKAGNIAAQFGGSGWTTSATRRADKPTIQQAVNTIVESNGSQASINTTKATVNRNLELQQTVSRDELLQQESVVGSDGWWRRTLILEPGESQTVIAQVHLNRGRLYTRRYKFEIHTVDRQSEAHCQPIEETVELGGFRVPRWIH